MEHSESETAEQQAELEVVVLAAVPEAVLVEEQAKSNALLLLRIFV